MAVVRWRRNVVCGVAYRAGCAVLSGIGDYGKENVDTSSWKRTDLEVRQRRASDLERLLRSPTRHGRSAGACRDTCWPGRASYCPYFYL